MECGTTGRGAAGARERSQSSLTLPCMEHHSNLRPEYLKYCRISSGTEACPAARSPMLMISSDEAVSKFTEKAGAGGRLRASATTFEAPETCLTSVNSEMKDKWRVWRGDFSAELPKAPHKGL